MKKNAPKLLILIILILGANTLQGQNIIELVSLLPSNSIAKVEINIEKAVQNYDNSNKSILKYDNDKWAFTFDTIDIRSGFLKYKYWAIEGQRTIYGEVCYWNITNGNKIIGIKKEFVGPWDSAPELEFYEYNNQSSNVVKKSIYEIIPEYDFIKNEFIKYARTYSQSDINKIKAIYRDLIVSYSISLPQKGKNITVGFNGIIPTNEENFFMDILRNYKPEINDIEYVWIDGMFIMKYK